MAKLHEECGVFGIFDPKGNPANTTYYGLVAYSTEVRKAVVLQSTEIEKFTTTRT